MKLLFIGPRALSHRAGAGEGSGSGTEESGFPGVSHQTPEVDMGEKIALLSLA